MGQKTNPVCLRLGKTHSHHSIWFEEPKKYSTGIQEDQKIRDFFKNYIQYRLKKYAKMVTKEYLQQMGIKKYFQPREREDDIFFHQTDPENRMKNLRIPPLGFEGIVRIEIEKQGTKTQKTFIRIIIYSGLVPKFLFKRNLIANFRENIKKQEFYSVYPRKIRIQFKKAKKIYSQPNLLAEFIALQLKNRVHYKRTMKEAIDLARRAGVTGIKLKFAGRVDGKDKARKESERFGKLPLHIFFAKIDYCSHTMQTIHGILGLKIWTFRE